MTEEKSIIDLAQGRTPQSPGAEQSAAPAEQALRPNQRAENQPGDKSKEYSDILNSLLENVQSSNEWVQIELPTRRPAQIRPFNYEDEKILRSIGKATNAAGVLKELISRCLKDVDIDSMYMGDFTYTLFKLRELTYGNEYKIEVNCEECGGKNELNVELNNLNVNYADDDFMKSTVVTLPDSKKNVTIRKPLVRDSETVDDMSKFTENLWRFVTDIEGHTDRMIIQTFIRKTTVKDISTIRENIGGSEVGLDTAVRYLCRDCNADNSVQLPLTPDFFTVS